MKKKLFVILFIIFIGLMFNSEVNASLLCRYKFDTSKSTGPGGMVFFIENGKIGRNEYYFCINGKCDTETENFQNDWNQDRCPKTVVLAHNADVRCLGIGGTDCGDQDLVYVDDDPNIDGKTKYFSDRGMEAYYQGTLVYSGAPECKYKNQEAFSFTVNLSPGNMGGLHADGIAFGYEGSDHFEQEPENVDNWNKDAGVTDSKILYYENGCPSTAVLFYHNNGGDNYKSYIVNSQSDIDKLLDKHIEYSPKYLYLVDPLLDGKQYTITFNNDKEGVIGTQGNIIAKHGTNAYIPKPQYTLYGWTLTHYRVEYQGKWLCENGKYADTCNRYEAISPDSFVNMWIDKGDNNPVLKFHAQWTPNANIDSQSINYYGLGENVCGSHGFIWNVLDENDRKIGYCNVDHLKYIMCGDTHDIPIEVPNIISFIVNLLKIATPIILIVICVITLLKAMAASNEDELKKAQKGLIRKMIAAAMVFFIISIVQFVILKAADATEKDDILDCMSCFVNGDCMDTTYYKTTINGVTYCTKIVNSKTENMISCDVFYQKNK